MAKKKKTGGEFNMAAEIRSLLEKNRALTGSETLALIQKKHPKAKLNKNSFGVAFYGARNKLGISSKRQSKKKRPTGQNKVVVRRTPAKTDATVDIATLQQAARFVSEVGDAQKAIDAIRQLRTLQIH